MYKVYRNLNNGKLSIQENGLVVGHADNIIMLNVVFKVNQIGREKVIREKKKNVHAFVIGEIACTEGFTSFKGRSLKRTNTDKLHNTNRYYRGNVVYNPFKYDSFKLVISTFDKVNINMANMLEINKSGLMQAYHLI